MTEEAAQPGTAPAPPPRRRRRVLTARRLLFWLFGGLAVNIGVAITIAGCVDPTSGIVTSASAIDSEDRWSVTRFDRPGVTVVISESESGSPRSWSTRQVIGPPNTPSLGDISTAWASSTTDGQVEWLELSYATAVVPRAVRVYETYNPGALIKVVAYRLSDGAPVTAWEGKDPSPPGTTGVGISEVPLAVDFPVQRVRIYLDSPNVPGWNEIDAVGLIDRNGGVQWVTRCKASSVYGQSASPSPSTAKQLPQALLPSYGDLHDEPADGATRIVAGFGWPMISVWESISAPPQNGAGSVSSTITTSSLTGPPSSAYTTGFVYPPASPPASPTVLPARVGVPHHPAWVGLGINTLVFAPLVALLHFLVVVPRRFMAEVARVRRGACIRCGYDLGYDFQRGCPECGWRRQGDAAV